MTDARFTANQIAVLTEILAAGSVTRSAISARTGLSGATVSRAVEALVGREVVRASATMPPDGRGRPADLLEARGEHAFVCGIDLGASNTRIVVADVVARVLATRRVPTPTGLGPEGLAAWIAAEVRTTAGHRWPAVRAVGLGLPGAVRIETRAVSDAPNLGVVEDPDFLPAVDDGLGMRVIADNDANFAMLGEERFGAARSAATAVMFTIGAGLGAGVVIGGRLLRGRIGLVGEFGHLPVGPLGTPLEHMITGPGIMRRAAELGVGLESPSQLFAPDMAATELRRRVEDALFIMLTAATVSYEPDVIVLGGRIAQSLVDTLPRLRRRLVDTVRYAPVLAPALLGDLSGAYGAEVAALRSYYRSLGVPEGHVWRLPPGSAVVAASDADRAALVARS